MRYLNRSLAGFLALVHFGLFLWAVVGFLEFHPDWHFTDISNPLFGRSMLLWQWTIVLITSMAFLAGFFARFSRLPETMAILYGLLAITCTYQTFFILQHDARFWQMALEFVEYAIILWILFQMKWFQIWLGRITEEDLNS
tara:strand:+ start:70 stop:492 length:423 start_codon:yes stop_codon:yes gene_type:complete